MTLKKKAEKKLQTCNFFKKKDLISINVPRGGGSILTMRLLSEA